jgi:hypothetical protein
MTCGENWGLDTLLALVLCETDTKVPVVSDLSKTNWAPMMEEIGGCGYRSRCLSHAKRSLYHLS